MGSRRGCAASYPTCDRLGLMPFEQPLSLTHPDLAAQWHEDLNGDLTPMDVDASYAEDVWWVCDKGDPFRAQLNSRARYGSGCPVCANKRVRPGINDLATLDPELAAQWHQTRNGELTPDVVAPGYKGEVWWQPPCGHWFARSPLQRKADRRCQVCVDKRVFPGQNDLVTVHPELVGDLAPGQDLDPTRVRATSKSERFKWVAPCGHVYAASPYERHVDATAPPCSKCGPKKLAKRSSLPMVDEVPWLLALWDHAANAPTTPSEVKAGDNRNEFHWRCSKGHTWERRPRTQKPECGYCAGRELLPGFNDLATVNPALAAQWHTTENGDLTPEQFLPKSNVKVWWLGPCGHKWDASIANRSNGSGCRRKCPESRVPPMA